MARGGGQEFWMLHHPRYQACLVRTARADACAGVQEFGIVVWIWMRMDMSMGMDFKVWEQETSMFYVFICIWMVVVLRMKCASCVYVCM